MAALLVAVGVMAVLMSAALPVWRHQAQREKEAELVFRGEQYARAIGLYQRKMGPGTYPPTIDVLVQQRFLRKKFKDPITNDDFAPILAGQGVPAGGQQPGGQRGGTGSTTGGGAGRGTQPGLSTQSQSGVGRPAGPQLSATGQTAGGIQGVTSKSKDQSIRLYNGRGHYNEWAFVYIQQQQAPGAAVPGAVPGAAVPGAGTGRPTGPGGAGRPTGPGGVGRPTGPGGAGRPTGPGGFGRPTGPGGSPAQPILPPGPGRR